MNRRRFIATTLGLAASSVLPAFGQLGQKVEVPLERVIEAYNSQKCPSWCWAASISMLFELYGHPIDQRRIAATLYKTPPPCKTSSPSAILHLINQGWKDDNGETFHCRTDALYDQFAGVDNMHPQDIIDSLGSGDPLLLCTTHHCMVLTEVHYIPTPMGPSLTEMGVADPWPGAGLRSLNAAEGRKVWAGGQLSILASVDVT